MTQRDFYDAILYELNQYNGPDFLLEDFIYWGNKSIDNYVKKRYNVYDVNQQVTDDLAELKGSVVVTPSITRDNTTKNITAITGIMEGDETKNPLPISTAKFNNKNLSFEFELPDSYYHTTDVIVNYTVVNDSLKCKGYRQGDTFSIDADRIPAGQLKLIQSKPFLMANYRRPYYFILNAQGKSVPKMRIMAGNISPTFEFQSIDVFYVKLPSKLTLTQDQIDSTSDTSDEMEFNDPQVREIIKECTTLLLATWGDPRIQSKPIVDQAVAQPQGPDTQLSR